MPRSNRPRRAPAPGRGPARRRPVETPDDRDEGMDADRILFGLERGEVREGREWRVRAVTGAAAGKAYRCPGCDQEIPAGVPHLVVWPADPIGFGGVEDRRHWHTPCWRTGRRPTRR